MLAAGYYSYTEHDHTHEMAWPGMLEFLKLHLLESDITKFQKVHVSIGYHGNTG